MWTKYGLRLCAFNFLFIASTKRDFFAVRILFQCMNALCLQVCQSVSMLDGSAEAEIQRLATQSAGSAPLLPLSHTKSWP